MNLSYLMIHIEETLSSRKSQSTTSTNQTTNLKEGMS